MVLNILQKILGDNACTKHLTVVLMGDNYSEIDFKAVFREFLLKYRLYV